MLLMSTLRWILLIGLGVVILAVVFGTKIKDKYFQKVKGYIRPYTLMRDTLINTRAKMWAGQSG